MLDYYSSYMMVILIFILISLSYTQQNVSMLSLIKPRIDLTGNNPNNGIYNNNHSNKDTDYIHIIYALGKSMIPLTFISIHSIIYHSINPKLLYFHIVLIDMQWNSEFLLGKVC